MDKTEVIWLDGKLVPWDEARVHVLTHSLHYGVAAFEGIRCYRLADGRSAVFRLGEHLRRLFDSARMALMDVPYTAEQVRGACLDVLRQNRLEEGYLRPLVFFGEGAMGLGAKNVVRVAVAAWRWGAYLGDEGVRRGIRAKVSSLQRMSPAAHFVKAKLSGQYVNSVLAKREALLGGYDEAVLLDAQGLVAEASGENIFLVRDGVLLTPPTSAPILDGITRDSVLTIARDEGLPVREEGFTRAALYNADEAFLTGTAAEITPVREVDDRKVGTGEPGPITARLRQAFFRAVRGEDSRYGRWLDPL